MPHGRIGKAHTVAMRTGVINRLLAGLAWIVLFVPNLLLRSLKRLFKDNHPSAAGEKRDVLERADWLAGKILPGPERLLDGMPSVLGRFYGGQWAIYTCSHFSAALLNISRLYPEQKELCLARMKRVIEIVLSPAMREYDTMKWKEDALETLDGAKSHMTYLSILAWIVTCYRMAGGAGEYDSLLHSCCEALDRRMHMSRDMNLLSFPGAPVFLPDMLFCIVALHNYSTLYGGRYSDTVRQWLDKAKNEWTDKRTGLLVSMLYRYKSARRGWRPRVRGSYTALNCYCLSLVDASFARDQYERMKRHLVSGRFITGIREYLNWAPPFRLDVDAGPIVNGLSPSGTAWAIGCATFFRDWELRKRLLHAGDIAGITVRGWKKRHYLLGSLVIVGEAVTLAMRTNYQFND